MALVSSIVLIVAFSLIYLVTKSAYINASKSRIQESLTAQIYALMAVAEDRDAQLTIPELLRNDQLNHLNSGLIAYVLDVDGDLIWRSRSSDTYAFLPEISSRYSLQEMLESELDGRQFFWVGDRIIWEHENGMEGEYLFLIGERQSVLLASVRQYKREIALWLSVTAIVLILVLIIALNLSLYPLKEAQDQIEKVSAGEIDNVKGEFPAELRPLTSSINQLLVTEKLQKSRYRDTLGNLAHSLKTPLAVIKNELEAKTQLPSVSQITKQVQRIDDIVKYQLNRSVISAGQVMKRKTIIEPEVEKIVDALKKIHSVRGLDISADVQSECCFPGEPGDLMELVGNLADNACKWARKKVAIVVYNQNKDLYLIVKDDGAGIPEEKRSQILARGKRLDQKAEGQGLGLSIVLDIVNNYRGKISISDNQPTGAIFEIIIPDQLSLIT